MKNIFYTFIYVYKNELVAFILFGMTTKTKLQASERHAAISKRRSPSQERSRQRVERILDAASTLLTSNSVDKLTTRRIAEVANVNIATLYQFYPNKEAIIFALYEKWLDETGSAFDRAEAEYLRSGTWREFFDQLIDALAATNTGVEVKDRLQKAMGMNEDLRQLDLLHGQRLADRMVNFLQILGAKLPLQELQNISMLLFHFERALVTPMANSDEEQKPLIYSRGKQSLLEVIGMAFK
ncbi:TetR/AcrR family transcriptional regulator [Kiloniella sp.]|uniref:TetR/AcrR family transcriptional regulator n=1 Tax=Kiloniella sp. TaxID=1938587 RepID=UPI003B01E18E